MRETRGPKVNVVQNPSEHESVDPIDPYETVLDRRAEQGDVWNGLSPGLLSERGKAADRVPDAVSNGRAPVRTELK